MSRAPDGRHRRPRSHSGPPARTIALAEWIKELKRISSLWIKDRTPAVADFQWQAGYAAFTVSQSQSPQVERYITN
jgi:putative transposase